MHAKNIRTGLSIATLLMMAGVAQAQNTSGTDAATTAPPAGTMSQSQSDQATAGQNTASAPAPSDAQIAEILMTADEVDMNAGKLAESKSKNPQVKQFANQMVNDHQSVNKQVKEVAKSASIKPKDSETSKTLEKNGKETVSSLKKLKGNDFDQAYIKNEIAYHEQVLTTIDNTLIPNAKNEQLKTLLNNVRPAIEGHLSHAKMIQSAMASKAAAGTSGGAADPSSGSTQ